MTEVPIGLVGGLNSCYVFYMRFQDCIKKESLFHVMCRNEYEDWYECKFAKRHVSR